MLADFIIALGLISVLLLPVLWLLDWVREERNTDPIQAWDQGHRAGLYVVSTASDSDRDIADAWIAARLAHEHRVGAEG